MNKLKQILEFIRALLGFLLNLKKRKKKKDEKNENPEKSLWRSESNAKEFCLKRPCVFLKTLRSFGTNALMSFSQTLK